MGVTSLRKKLGCWRLLSSLEWWWLFGGGTPNTPNVIHNLPLELPIVIMAWYVSFLFFVAIFFVFCGFSISGSMWQHFLERIHVRVGNEDKLDIPLALVVVPTCCCALASSFGGRNISHLTLLGPSLGSSSNLAC